MLLENAIHQILTVITLGLFSDISHLIPPQADPTSTLIAYLVVIARFAIAGVAIYLVASKILDRLGYDPAMAILIVAGVLIVIALITHPWVIAKDLSDRLGGFERAMNDYRPVKFTPTLLRSPPFNYTIGSVYYGVSMLNRSLEQLKSATSLKMTLPDVGSGYRITTKTVTFNWIYYLITFVIIGLTFYILKSVSKWLALTVVGVEVALLLGISAGLVVTIVLIGLFVVASVYLIKSGYVVWSIYPIIVAVLLALSLISLPKALLIVILSVLLYLSLIPVFYAIGWFIAGVGELVEQREKFGLKVKPKKVIEEQAGVWDEVAIAVVLSALFLVSIALYGATILGVGTFMALSLMILR